MEPYYETSFPATLCKWVGEIVQSSPEAGRLTLLELIVGALLIRGIPDLIQGLMVAGVITLSGDATSMITGYRFLVFGLLMVIMMAVRPQGMIPSKRRALELRPEDHRVLAEEDQQMWDIEHRDVEPDDV